VPLRDLWRVESKSNDDVDGRRGMLALSAGLLVESVMLELGVMEALELLGVMRGSVVALDSSCVLMSVVGMYFGSCSDCSESEDNFFRIGLLKILLAAAPLLSEKVFAVSFNDISTEFAVAMPFIAVPEELEEGAISSSPLLLYSFPIIP